MSVSRDDVKVIASLARLHVAEERLDAVAEELSGILLHMDVLQQVDITADGLDTIEGTMPLRDDTVDPQPLVHERESFAPLMRDGFFLVPRLATHDNQGAGPTE